MKMAGWIENEFRTYVALLQQSGTDAPVATVIKNTLGDDVVWSRSDVGQYFGTCLINVFSAGKTIVNINNVYTEAVDEGDIYYISCNWGNNDHLDLFSSDATASTGKEGNFKCYIEVKVFD